MENIKKEKKHSLPKGWEIKKLGEVCNKGSSNISQNKLINEKGIYPIFGASGFIKNISFYHNDKPYLSIVKDGSGIGRVTKMDAYTSVTGTLQYIYPKEGIDLNYLYYSLLSIDFKKYATGAAIPHIYFKDYKNEPFLWMPLSEQRRIVSILDKCFSAIERSRNNAEQNLKNAKEIFESYLNKVFASSTDTKTKHKNWEEKKLGEVAEIINGGTPKTSITEYWNGEIYWITPADLGKLTKPTVDDTSRKITKMGLEKSSAKLFPENSVILSTRAPIGHLAINKVPMSTNQGCRGIVPNQKLNTWFLYYFLKNNVKLLNSLGTGTTFKELSTRALAGITIPLPPLVEQQTIVHKLDTLRIETQKLESIYQKKILLLEELKKSILQKAFSGELN